MSEDLDACLNGAMAMQWQGDGHPLINHEVTTATGRPAVIKGVRQAPDGSGVQFLLAVSGQDYIVMDENTLRMAIHSRSGAPIHPPAPDRSQEQEEPPAGSAAAPPPSSAGDLLARVKPEPQLPPEVTVKVDPSRQDGPMSPALEDPAPLKSEAPPPRPRGVKRPRPSTAPPVPMTPELLTTLQELLERLASPPFAKNFCRPVADSNAEAMERYRALIKRPIDLGTIYVKLRQAAYPDLARFEKEVERVFNNCERFNSQPPTNHLIVAHAKHLRDFFHGLYSEMVACTDGEERQRRREERLAACQDVVMGNAYLHLMRQRIEAIAGHMAGSEDRPGEADLTQLEAILSPTGGLTVRAVYEALGALGHGGLRAGALEALHLATELVYEKTYRGAVYSSIWARPCRLVWAAQKKGVLWPCMVLMEGDVPEALSRVNRQRMPLEAIRSLKRTNKIAGACVVETFGTHEFHWAAPDTLRPYSSSGGDPNEKNTKKEGFERGCTEIRYAHSAMNQEPGYAPEEPDVPDRLQSMDLQRVEEEVQRLREVYLRPEEGGEEEDEEEEAAVALLRNEDEKRRSLEARPRAPKKPKDAEEGPTGVGGSAKKRRVAAGGRKIKKQNAIDKIRQFVVSIGLQDKVLRELNVAARPKIKRRLVVASPPPFVSGEAPSARDLLDAPMLFGGRAPLPTDPYETDSDLEDLGDEDVDWTNAAQRKNAMRRREQALQREITALQEVRRKQRAFAEQALGPSVHEMFAPLPVSTPGLHEAHSGYPAPTTAPPKKPRARASRENAAETDREGAGYHYEPSKFTGVCRSGARFTARITVGGRKHNLGSFETEKEAALAYDQAAREHYGAKAKVNFDEHGNCTNLKMARRPGPTSPVPPRTTYESMQGGGRGPGGYGGGLGYQSGSGASSDGEGAYGGQYQQAQLSETESEEDEPPRAAYSPEMLRARERLDEEDDDDDDTDVTDDEEDRRAYYGNVFDAYRMAVQGRQQQQQQQPQQHG